MFFGAIMFVAGIAVRLVTERALIRSCGGERKGKRHIPMKSSLISNYMGDNRK
jgi:hypothetical protein